MKHFGPALVFSILLAMAGSILLFSSFGQVMEERLGLAVLFKLRGPRQPPEKVAVVNVDRQSPLLLNLPERYNTWSRAVYTRLLDRLNAYGAAVVVFDLHFADARDPVEDRAFGEAIRRAGKVILCEKLVRRTINADDGAGIIGIAEIEERVPPTPLLAESALALAPFPVPKVPIRINRAWTFKAAAGDIPTLPVVALQALAFDVYEQWFTVLQHLASDRLGDVPATVDEVVATIGLVETMRRMRAVLLHPDSDKAQGPAITELLATMPVEQQRLVQALLAVYRGNGSLYLDYYGPPATIPTIPFHEVLNATGQSERTIREILRGAVVFVGVARTSWSEQKDGFYTVFSRDDGLDLSGVELAATVFANLLENRSLVPLSFPLSGGILALVSIIGCLFCFLLAPATAAMALIVAAVCYLLAVHALFTLTGTWLPVVVPLTVLLPGAFLAAILYKYVKTRYEREHIEKALRLYLPDTVVEELSRDLSFVKTGDRMVYGACLLTDAQNYTTLSEHLSPPDLSALMNRYYEQLFRQVRQQDGQVCNVVGDAMFALWPSTRPQMALKVKACQAALRIHDAIKQFNLAHPQQALPTRVGIHAGYLLMGNIGAEGHFEYAPVGDIVNTASRIEGLNKQLGTWVLASEEASGGVTGMATRCLGSFLLGGKSKPVTINELSLPAEHDKDRQRLYTELFPEALALFHQRRWDQAAVVFRHSLTLQPDDGPSLFYLHLCAVYEREPPPENWQGAIRLEK